MVSSASYRQSGTVCMFAGDQANVTNPFDSVGLYLLGKPMVYAPLFLALGDMKYRVFVQ